MMAPATAAFSVTFAALFLGTAHPLALVVAAAASQLPDVDTSRSRVGRLLWPISRRLERRFAHRSITHSFLATFAIALATWPLTLAIDGLFWRAAVWGYLLGWFSDVFTKSGVAAFWPYDARLVIPGNPRWRLSTGSPAEYLLFVVLVLAAIAVIHINASGGIVRSFVQMLGNPQGAVQVFEEEGGTHLVYLQVVNGYDSLSLQPVEGEFEVVQVLGEGELLVTDGDRFLSAGSSLSSNIRLNRVRTRIGEAIDAIAISLSPQFQFVDELLLDYVGERTYISGQLKLENTYDLQAIPEAGGYPVIRLQPLGDGQAIAHLQGATPAKAIAMLGPYLATEGQLMLRKLEVKD